MTIFDHSLSTISGLEEVVQSNFSPISPPYLPTLNTISEVGMPPYQSRFTSLK